MSEDQPEGFLGRWSRLKRTAVRPEPEPQLEEKAEPEPAPPPGPETLSEEELAALPRIEDLTEGSDITAFLRAGVPRHLRNGALRRMWMMTPAIRDYRDPAVDYAWDWNTPGGVPGNGIAPSAERAAEMLRAIVAPREKIVPQIPAPDGPEAEDASSTMETEIVRAAPPEAQAAARHEDGATPDPDGDPEPDTMPRRRHGSARPG